MAADDPGTLARELVHLLLQVAWSDGEIAPAEAGFLRSLGRQLALPAAELAALEDFIAGRARLPPPDLGYLRRHRDRALQLVRDMALVDGALALDEKDVLGEIQGLLTDDGD